MTSKHGRVMTHGNGLLHIDSQKSSDKLKTLYLHHDNVDDHKTYQCSDITQGAPTHRLAWPHNEAVMWGHVTNWIHYISICRRPMNIKLGKVLTFSEVQIAFNSKPLYSRVLLFVWLWWKHGETWRICSNLAFNSSSYIHFTFISTDFEYTFHFYLSVINY